MVDVLPEAGLEIRDELDVYCRDAAQVGVFGSGVDEFISLSIACCHVLINKRLKFAMPRLAARKYSP
ncbi:hypothetical protein D3C77_609100 [compost metagenome]